MTGRREMQNEVEEEPMCRPYRCCQPAVGESLEEQRAPPQPGLSNGRRRLHSGDAGRTRR